MSRPLNKNANFVSVSIFNMRQIASRMNDEELGSWVRKALDDMSIGCIGNDVDPVVKSAYADAFSAMVKEQERKKIAYENKKKSVTPVEVISAEIIEDYVQKRDDQLIWGRFENVFLSNDEYNTLLTDIGNINEMKELIDSFSAALEDGKTQSFNHYATLTRWISWRKKHELGKETFQEREGRRQTEQLRRFGLIR